MDYPRSGCLSLSFIFTKVIFYSKKTQYYPLLTTSCTLKCTLHSIAVHERWQNYKSRNCYHSINRLLIKVGVSVAYSLVCWLTTQTTGIPFTTWLQRNLSSSIYSSVRNWYCTVAPHTYVFISLYISRIYAEVKTCQQQNTKF